MKYIGMPHCMWLLFVGSFRYELTNTLKFDRMQAKTITASAKPLYHDIIRHLPDFEKGDIAAHSVCAVLMMAVKQALICGISPETVNAAYRTPFLVSFAATNLWVTVTELSLSVAYIYYMYCKELFRSQKQQ